MILSDYEGLLDLKIMSDYKMHKLIRLIKWQTMIAFQISEYCCDGLTLFLNTLLNPDKISHSNISLF